MRRSNGSTSRIPAPVAIVLTLCFLWLLLMPHASAADMLPFEQRIPAPSEAEGRQASSDRAPAMPFMAGNGEDGRVSDHDGIIGNSGRGADHAPDSNTDPTKGGKIPSGAAHDGVIGHNRMTDHLKRAADDVLHAAEQAGQEVTDAAEQAVQSMRTGATPWIIGFLVLLAATLVILALIPKRGKSR